MNYIHHLNKVFGHFNNDDRLTPMHISLYLALFQCWNMTHFKNPISISREEVMRIAKIGSANTYIKCMRELNTWNYIKYIPSYNPMRGSKVYLYRFDIAKSNAVDNAELNAKNNADNNADSKADNNADSKADNNADDTAENNAFDMPLRPSINNTVNNTINNTLNNTKHIILEKKENSKNNFISNEPFHEEKRKKVAPKKEKSKQLTNRIVSQSQREELTCKPPIIEEVKIFFQENNWENLHAERFFNHFESNGWLVSGKSPMKNWHAAARNWILNAQKFAYKNSNFNTQNSGQKMSENRNSSNYLHVNQDKNYAEPL
jgi:hypothetical protein